MGGESGRSARVDRPFTLSASLTAVQHYRAIERQLYELGEPPHGMPARPQLRLVPRHVQPGPRSAPREVIRRLDLSIATRRLTPDQIEVIRSHYILKVRRHSRAEREPIIRELASLLG